MKLPQNEINLWRNKIAECLSADRYRLNQQLNNIGRRIKGGKPFDRDLKQFVEGLEHSCQQVISRRQSVPTIEYPEELPIAERRNDISEAIANHQVVVVAGETGSGKTTQLPKICLALGRGVTGMIGHTQPRRIAARTVANRIAEELNQPLGVTVGYQVRFNETSSENTLVKLMTDGILLAEIQHDRYLNKYDTIIIDEAHERSLNIDFLLGYLKNILPKRPDLKLIITSATIDVERFSQHFHNAPVIEVSGRAFPVDVEYLPVQEERDLGQSVLDTVEHILTLPKRGDILVFHSGEREIRETAHVLRRAQLPHLEVVPLYARLSLAEQTKVFKPHKGIRVVLATNVAETSLTVPGIRYVIDPGTARVSRYSYRTKVQRLPIEAISQASANQRKGRCGRISEGVCFRLYSEEDFSGRPEFTDPEITRTNLASVILRMLHLRIGDIRDFPFVESPDNRLINDGFSLLQELQAVNGKGELTPIGRQLCRIQADPKMGRMLLASEKEGALKEVLIIVSALSVQDPRDRPSDKQQAADEKHRQWQDKDSDFVALINLWRHFEEQRQELTRNQFERYCRQNFVSPLRMREWRDLHHQLHGACRELKLNENHQPAGYDAIHRALLSGLLGQIGFRHEAAEEGEGETAKGKGKGRDSREYTGTRNRKFYVFPGSGLNKKPPKWLMAAEMLETSRLFSHHNAKIDPDWLPTLAAHLVKKTYREPHYSLRNGQVMAYEKQTLYGLPIVEKRRCAYGKIDPVLSREIFIRSALVEGEYRGKGAFFHHNQQLQENLQDIESRTRRRDVLVDDQVMFDFYSDRIPQDIVNLAGFEYWRKQQEQCQEQGSSELLYMNTELLSQQNSGDLDESKFPDHIEWQGMRYPLSYHFEPRHQEDGVSVTVPISVLHQVPSHRFDWLVPGMLRDKCIALIKGLPKVLRRNFVPVPDYVDKALLSLNPADIRLSEALGTQLKLQTGIDVTPEHWQQVTLEDIYRLNIKLIDENNHVLTMSRHLSDLKAQYRGKVAETLTQATTNTIEREDLHGWDFDALPEVYSIEQQGLTIRTYPSLVIERNQINLTLLDNPEAAANQTIAGLIKLYQCVYPESAKYLSKQLLKGMDLQLKSAGISGKDVLIPTIIDAAYGLALLKGKPIPRTKSDFDALLTEGKGSIVTVANELESMLISWLPLLSEIRKTVKKQGLATMHAVADIQQQLGFLFCEEFMFRVPINWLRQYQRYLKALMARLEKLPVNPQKDRAHVLVLEKLEQQLADINLRWEELPAEVRETVWMHRFMLQEYRVSLFSQQLKTAFPISDKRIKAHWKELEVLLSS
ncbi:MAG: ATP-dependent RNA helicase HrpA [Porticoccus sp.]|nr:ATP-dependent RNA helicase HrpA [Porticoccus sp.]